MRYVALGDSSTEGLKDPDGRGGYRGWSRRLAEKLAAREGSIEYANLAVRGSTTREVRKNQLAPALELRPDLVTLFVGTNDVLCRKFDARQFEQDLETMQRSFIEAGAKVLGLTIPDLSPVLPFARLIRRRIKKINHTVHRISDATGATLIAIHYAPVASDRRIWDEDRLHVNAEGHARIAAAVGEHLGLEPGGDWHRELPPAPPATALKRVAIKLHWTAKYLIPWLGRQALGLHAAGRVDPPPPVLEVLTAEPKTELDGQPG